MRLYEILDIIEAVKMPHIQVFESRVKKNLIHCVLFND